MLLYRPRPNSVQMCVHSTIRLMCINATPVDQRRPSPLSSGGDLAPSWGEPKKFSADPSFLNEVFWGTNFHFRGKNI